jgi:hypothetical protein
MPRLSLTSTSLPLSLLLISSDFSTRTTWVSTESTRPSGSLVTARSKRRLINIGDSNESISRSKSLFVDSKIRCLRWMWRGVCASVGWSRQGRWYVFKGLCKTIGKHSAYLRGLWNVGVCPEKGMMLRLRWKNLVSAVMTMRTEK